MNSNRQLFFRNLAQTSETPLALEITHSKGVYLYDADGKEYIDLISGISVSSLGHSNPKIVQAVSDQASRYMHTMVYGEMIQSPQVKLAFEICSLLPENLNSVYFVNSGSEAVEGAMKLAKRFTGRPEIVSFKNGYHGSSHGALSIMGEEELKTAYRPLLPQVRILDYNDVSQLGNISEQTACVIVEPVQGEAGVMAATPEFLSALRVKCSSTGTLLVFDEIQTGMGRTGSLFAFEKYGVTPDILLLAKAFGGGMPLGAFISSQEIMSVLRHNPALGHITTFGGHPVCCAAGLTSLKIIVAEKLYEKAYEKGNLIRKILAHSRISEVRGEGLLLAVDLGDEGLVKKVIEMALVKGVLVDWFLFNPNSIRIAPPLIINDKEIESALNILLECIDRA
jgi:acetylornithine/succinyldiaminopimelate/putrescine aminotransferase